MKNIHDSILPNFKDALNSLHIFYNPLVKSKYLFIIF